MKSRSLVFSAALVSIVAFAAGACTFTEGDVSDLNFGGDGGANATGGLGGGSLGGGTSTGGTGEGGSGTGGEPVTLDCSDDGTVLGTPGEAPDESDACRSCLYDLCAETYESCYATGPVTACAEADIPTMFDGAEITVTGEFTCLLACMQEAALVDPAYDASVTYLETNCVPFCGAAECDRVDEAGLLARGLGYCAVGIEPNGVDPLPGDCWDPCGIGF